MEQHPTGAPLELEHTAAALTKRVVALETDLQRALIEGENTAAIRAELGKLRGQEAQLAAEITQAHEALQQAKQRATDARLYEETLEMAGASRRWMATQLAALKAPLPPVPPAASAYGSKGLHS